MSKKWDEVIVVVRGENPQTNEIFAPTGEMDRVVEDSKSSTQSEAELFFICASLGQAHFKPKWDHSTQVISLFVGVRTHASLMKAYLAVRARPMGELAGSYNVKTGISPRVSIVRFPMHTRILPLTGIVTLIPGIDILNLFVFIPRLRKSYGKNRALNF